MSNTRWEVYRDPGTSRHYDPFRLLSALQHYAGGAKAFNDLVRDQGNPTALLKLAAVGRRAFGLPAVDPATGEGVPDAAVLRAIEDFTGYVRGKGDGAGNWRTWSQPSASPPPSAPETCSRSG